VRIVALFRSGVRCIPAMRLSGRVKVDPRPRSPLSDRRERSHSDSHATRYAFQLRRMKERNVTIDYILKRSTRIFLASANSREEFLFAITCEKHHEMHQEVNTFLVFCFVILTPFPSSYICSNLSTFRIRNVSW